jgi:predicted metal-binding membrane protein
MLSAVGLIRPSRRRGFCPACRLFQIGDGPQEIAAPALIAVAFLVVAVLAWALTIARWSSMDGTAMGFGPVDQFIASWAVMMAAMMLPSAMPLVFDFARNSERRRGWPAATVLLGATYLGVWLGSASCAMPCTRRSACHGPIRHSSPEPLSSSLASMG